MSPAPFLVPVKMSYFSDSPLCDDKLRKSVIRDIIPLMPDRIRTLWDVFSTDALATINARRFSDNAVCNAVSPERAKLMVGIRDGRIRSVDGIPDRSVDVFRRALVGVTILSSPYDYGWGDNALDGDFVLCCPPAVGSRYVTPKGAVSVWDVSDEESLLLKLSESVKSGADFGAVLSLFRNGKPDRVAIEFCEKNGYPYRRVGNVNVFSRGTTADDMVYATNLKL